MVTVWAACALALAMSSYAAFLDASEKAGKTSKGGQRFGTRHRNVPVSLDSNLDHGERIVAKLTSEIGAETTAELLQSLANKANGSQPSGEQGVVDVDSDDDDAEDEPFERQTPAAVRQLPQDEQEEQEVFSQLCAMLCNMYFQREHQLLASYTPDKEALWKTVRKIEDDFAAMAQEIKDEALIAFGKSDWSSNQPHLTNPRQRGLDHARFRARNQDQEEILKEDA